MMYTNGLVGGPDRDRVMRARSERAKVVSALLNGATAGLGNLTGKATRGLTRMGRNVVSGIVLARRRRAAIRELQTLNDRILKDIGISRGQIPYLVEKQLSAESAEQTEPTGHGDIAVFPDRETTTSSARVPLKPAA